jgi:predicted kinase
MEKPKERVRVSRDDIRRMLGEYWVPTRENLVTVIENDMIYNALTSGYKIVVDATNLRGTQRFKNLTENIKDGLTQLPLVEIEVKDFTDVPVETCIERDSLRKEDEQVGEEVIMRMYNKYLK